MAILITSAGTYTVIPGETYIIDPSVSGDVKFEAASGASTPTDFTVEINETGNVNKIQIQDPELSPTVNVADDVIAPNLHLELGNGHSSEVNIGDNTTVNKINLANEGDNTLNIGDGNTIMDEVTGGKQTDTVTIGDGNTFESKVDLFKGDDDLTIGDDNFFIKKLITGDGADVINAGDNNLFTDLKTDGDNDTVTLGTLNFADGFGDGDSDIVIDGAKHGNVPGDTLTFNPNNGDVAALIQELEDNGYELQPDGKTWIAGSDADYHIKWDIDGDDDDDVQINDWETIVLVCFARGTRIATRQGSVPIEKLKIGDEVITMDHGFQKIRWIGSSKVPARGHLAPVVIRKGAMGNERDLRVSPQHRMLVRGWHVELLFGKSEALVPAKALINDETVFALEGGEVEYFHMMFDRHELVYAEGIPSESFHPGHVGMGSFSEETREEILHLFPELREDVDAYSDMVRPTLKVQEAKVLAENSELLQER